MNIFGDLETPDSKPPSQPVVKQLEEITLKPHLTSQLVEGGPEFPVVRGVYDKPTGTVSLRAEAKTSFSDGTIEEGIIVTFFINGNRLKDVETDDFGVAVFNETVPSEYFNRIWSEDELAARIKGFAKEATAKVMIRTKGLTLDISHFWKKTVPSTIKNPPQHLLMDKEIRHEDLNFDIQANYQSGCGGFSLSGITISVQRCCVKGSTWESICTGTTDESGKCSFSLPKYYYENSEYHSDLENGFDSQETHPKNLRNSVFHTGSQFELRVTIRGYNLGNLRGYTQINNQSGRLQMNCAQ